MIVEMKKIYLVVQPKDAGPALQTLREMGVLHIDHVRSPRGSRIQHLKEDVQLLRRAIDLLPAQAVSGQASAGLEQDQWHEKARRIVDLTENMEALKESTGKRQIQVSQLEPWGNFDPDAIRTLQKQGIYVRLYLIPAKRLSEVPQTVALQVLSTTKGMARCLAVSREDVELPFSVVSLPQLSLQKTKELQDSDRQKIAQHEKDIAELSCYKDAFQGIEKERLADLEFQEAHDGMGDADDLVYLKGFAPFDRCEELKSNARENHWAILVETPDENDKVPTLLRNPKWVEMIKPVFQMINIVPGYREVDVSPFFLIFFTLFFGMLIGDAAYGAIFVVATFITKRKLRGKVQNQMPFYLMYLLTGFTMLWGILTGTYFGQEWLPSTIKAVVPWLTDSNNVQWLCFTIAAVHLSIARLWKLQLKLPSLTALSEIGWLLIVWGMYFLANMFVLSKPFPAFAGYLFMAGIPVALLFMVPFKDFLKKVPQELIPFMLGVIGSGTDIISYIRLFAVGLATVAVADAANFMPQALPFAVGCVFLILLHLINMILALMAILVHAIRLNLLEFSGHLGLEWSGLKYEPLKINKIK